MPPQIVLIGTILIFLGSLSYIRDTLRGRNKPNRVTWFLWGVVPMISTLISWREGASIWEILPIFTGGFIPFLIFFGSFFNKNSYWKLGIFDYVCGLLSVLAIIFWLLADNVILATLFTIIADGVAALPTLRKTWLEPQSESKFVYVSGIIDKALGLLILSNWAFVHSGFMIYLLCMNLIIIGITTIKPRLTVLPTLVDKKA